MGNADFAAPTPPPPRQRRFDCVSILGALAEGQEAMGGHVSYSEGEHGVLERT